MIEMKDTISLTRDDVISTEFDGGEGVLVDLNSKRYYQLNETAMLVWRCLEKGSSLEEITKEMTAKYEVSEEQAAASIEKIIAGFQSYKLL